MPPPELACRAASDSAMRDEILAAELASRKHAQLQHSWSQDIPLRRRLLVKKSRIEEEPEASENGAAREFCRGDDLGGRLRTRIHVEAPQDLDLRHS